MPADIRSFFGGKTATPIREKKPKEEDSKKKRAKTRKVIDDSEDDEPATKKVTPKPSAKKAVKKEEHKVQETTADDYFASSSKPKVKVAKPAKSTPKATPQATPTKPLATSNIENNSKSSTRTKKITSYSTHFDDDDFAFLDDDEDGGDDIFAANVKKESKKKDAYVESESDDEPIVKPKRVTTKPMVASSKKNGDVKMEDVDYSIVKSDDGDDVMMADRPSEKTGSKKRKSMDLDSEDEEPIHSVKSVKGKSAKPPPAKKSRAPAKPKEESSAIKAILDNIPTVRAPTPPPKDPNVKFDWRTAGVPAAAGSKEIPEGEENCLAGLTFVFTGLLETLQREAGQELVKRYGGKCTTAPSGKTSFVVLGSDAGPAKLRKIKDLNIKAINEDGLFALIATLPANGGDGTAAEANMAKKKAEMDKIKQDAEEMKKEEQRKVAEAENARKLAEKAAAAKGSTARVPAPAPPPPSSLLWTTKYAPTQINQICGNKGLVEKIQKWLKGWQVAHKYQFQKRGADGLGGERAICLSGPPGIGKTTAAHLAAKLSGYDILETNASDARSKKMVEMGFNDVLQNTSLLGYFAGDGKKVDATKKKIVLIMDEVDGMSGGDRGGVVAIVKLIKTSDIPIILICNERKLPKMKPLDHNVLDLQFRRPTVEQVRSRIATICLRENLKIPINVVDALIEGSNKDIRQIINMISTAKLDQTSMDFEQGTSMSKAWEKSVVLKPWDICHKLLGGGLFAPSSKATLNDKIELYFNDHEKSFLMLQENYLKTQPMLASGLQGREYKLKMLELADKAAESISDGDLVDRMIHGSQQQWSLMPTHGVFSTVRPASFISGMTPGGGSDFTQWLGQNSKQLKLGRYVKEIQSHMRLRTSGDRHEIRQQYLPVLWTQLINRLQTKGKECVDDVIDLMDSYFLTRDDFDFIMELGLGPQDQENVTIETQTKATFTRLYNKRSHPMPFMKASNMMAPTAKSKAEKPDLEEALEEDDDADVAPAPEIMAEGENIEDDLKKDKYIKQAKAKKPAAKKAASKKKKAANEDDDHDMIDDGSEEDVKPKKGKAKAKASTKGKGK